MDSKHSSDLEWRNCGRCLNSVSTSNPATFNHAAQDSSLSLKIPLQAHVNRIHARARIAGACDFEHGLPDFEALTLAKFVQAQTARGDVFLDLAGCKPEGVESFNVHQEHLTAAVGTGMTAALKTAIHNGKRFFDLTHGLARGSRKEQL
jgi:hypothetical protein